MKMLSWKLDQTWTILLDRDGVINRQIVGDYVRHWADFEFLPGVLSAISELSLRFAKIFIVTNQSAIGRRLMTLNELTDIHQRMREKIEYAGGRIDGIYFCPHAPEDCCNCRKPKTGLIEKILADDPGFNPLDSIMIGDSPSDIQFGRSIGAKTIQIGPNIVASEADLIVANLSELTIVLYNLHSRVL